MPTLSLLEGLLGAAPNRAQTSIVIAPVFVMLDNA